MLKNLLLLSLLVFYFSTLSAQITKGNWLVGGSASFYSSKRTFSVPNYTQKSSEFNLSVFTNIGYFIVDKFAVGLSPSLNWSKGKGRDGIDDNGNVVGSGGITRLREFLVGPFARYYLLSIDQPYNIQFRAAYQYGITPAYKPAKGNINMFSFELAPVLFFNSSVGLEFPIGYRFRSQDMGGRYKSTDNGLQLGLGLQIHLEK